ncbi:hypothetical protein QBC33DRAFT_528204 [Phialemonium atrogriseum]|uniref:Uncharacterized protein n=1 Tax=Phialemonium atrogriseum TaxID=1093897 RepID=A0AAJ0FPT0_9PEZI|nr:uncharacterized protein QBC33DRAFT_528204 [Phialemonium atrogriseum]KAK1770489.1 hypothetical protein QBC33DRAFT_528204 [Phialemonium atrogriseum]
MLNRAVWGELQLSSVTCSTSGPRSLICTYLSSHEAHFSQMSVSMGFGSSVAALLEIYSNCITLLKTSENQARDGSNGPRSHDQQSQLRRSLRSNRAQVRRAYSSGVSESGSRFEKGDARAKSALSRVLKKLRAAIANILQPSSKHQKPVLDYETLTLLSNASRIQATQACDQLSRRLGSSSSSRCSSASSSTSSKHKRRRVLSNSASSSKISSSGQQPLKDRRRKSRSGSEKPKGERRTSPTSPRPTSVKPHGRRTESGSRTPTPKRISLVSTSTFSTKLGEIPERKWRSRYSYDSSPEEYNIRPVYPLKPYESPAKKRGFFGLFRSRS